MAEGLLQYLGLVRRMQLSAIGEMIYLVAVLIRIRRKPSVSPPRVR